MHRTKGPARRVGDAETTTDHAEMLGDIGLYRMTMTVGLARLHVFRFG